MEEEMISGTSTKSDGSESKGSNSPKQKPKPSSRYKGVVPQANGHWGAQIYPTKSYTKRNRIWLGTFKTEDLAAAAYDSAAIKLHYGNSAEQNRNFPLNNFTCHEQAFQQHYSTDQVLNMIKDGSYQSKFYEFLSIPLVKGSHSHRIEFKKDGYFRKELFRKELTPSDVGKLKRLVIPKRYAQKFFDMEKLRDQDYGVLKGVGRGGDELELSFFDKSMRDWKFRYCLWQSSSTYVFTRGWKSFVKVKDLKEKDIVAFYMCELREKNNGNEVVKKFYMIDIVGSNTDEGASSSSKRDLEEEEVDDVTNKNDESQARKGKKLEEDDATSVENQEQGFRLFGVQILPENKSA